MRADRVAGGLGFVLAITYLVLTFKITSPDTVPLAGPRVVPIVVGVTLAVASLALLVKSLVDAPAERDRRNTDLLEEERLEQSPTRLIVAASLLFGYLLIFVPLGYIASTFLFILSITMYLDARHWVRNLVYACVFPLAVYLLFSQILRVPLPTGPLG